ncbi:MAG: SdrD B-like domain-containing protein, partial [Verrucomicrobiota bacterium]
GDGLQDPAESGLSHVTVELYRDLTNLLMTTVTDANGLYQFSGLVPGDYAVVVRPPAGFQFTLSDQGADDTLDSDASPTIVSLSSGIGRDDVDVGLYLPIEIGDLIWLDSNGDGLQGVGESGFPGVRIHLLDDMSNIVATTMTDGSGSFGFSGHHPGTYCLQIDRASLPGGAVITIKEAGISSDEDSDFDPLGKSDLQMLISGTTDYSFDGGFYRLGGVGDRVWDDLNGNGIQEVGEPGLSNLFIQLFDDVGVLQASLNSDGSGNYLFPDLAPGRYRIQFGPPGGYAPTTPHQGGDSNLDSDMNALGSIDPLDVVSGVTNRALDAGFFLPASIGNRVWEDLDGDGLQDAGEPGVAGVSVTLYDADTNMVSNATTDGSGAFAFNLLPPGTYQLVFAAPGGWVLTQPDQGGESVDSDPDSFGATPPVFLGAGVTNVDVDAGLFQPVGIDGLV